MVKKIREKINIFSAKSPKKAILIGIMFFNLIFIMIAAAAIAILSQHISGVTKCSFWAAVYRTITMMLDAGCIDGVIEDVGKAGAVAALVCLTVVLFGMVFFTGAIIGYITNIISDYIESKNNGKNKLHISGHIVIINWNSRAAEILNEFLYEKKEVKVVVFVPDNRDEIENEIRNRLNTTLIKETQQVLEATHTMSFFERKKYLRENLPKDNLTYIVREGDVAAATDLDDICISEAKTVIILANDKEENNSARNRGNTQTIKTLIQVLDIPKENKEQAILVEVTDHWTENLIYRIIDFKGKERIIIPVLYRWLLGITNSQIAIMPELNAVYDTLFSNKGPHIISQNVSHEYIRENENKYIEKHLARNCTSIPLAVMETIRGDKAFFMAASQSDLAEAKEMRPVTVEANLKENYSFVKRTIIVLGHNSNMDSLLAGFGSFQKEWNRLDGDDVIHVVMVDDEESLKNHNYYKDYPFVDTFTAGVYEDETIYNKVLELSQNAIEETTVLILSDDTVGIEDVDANVFAYLIYIQEQIRQREQNEPDFKRENFDIVVEILNPKNEDAVRGYGADNVIVSNRYVSRIISQICLGEAVYEFYADILSYEFDDEGQYGREIIIITAENFFDELPSMCTANELIRMVFSAGAEDNKSILLGYIRNNSEYILFNGDQRSIHVELNPKDKLILFSNHCKNSLSS